jgi:[acyl-carrier-protein] S-malonyltransferase
VLPAEVRASVVVAAGHSLGEFSAYLAGEALDFEDALRVVRRRGELMAGSGDERPGGMAAIMGLEPAAVEELCAGVEDGTVVSANFNAPGQIVISGDASAVERAQELALDAGSRVIPLNVSGAFHSPLMAVAREGLREALRNVEIRDPSFPVVANASAEPVTDSNTAREYLVAQLTSPVRWVDGVSAMMEFEPDRWLEVGPGRVLAGLLRRIDRTQRARAVGDPAAVEALEAENSNTPGES